MTYLGYPGTTGLTTMDYRITDAVADTPECESCYTEKLLRLPHSLWCYRPDLSMPEVSALPALKNGYLTFGSFNNFSKIDQDSIALWSEMLLAIPSSRLLLATVPEGILRNEIIDEFRDRGIDPQRLNIHSKLPKEQFLQLLQTADISLDPVTVNGATTTCDSLWLGVPVISKKGSRFRERAGLSLLKAAGIPEFAANDNDACVRLAVSLANDLPKLAGIRANLRRALTNSPLLDEKAFTKDLETIYKNAWDSWVERNNVLPDS
jgi:predicted O-linked N-acetylglucosamine transferase (SPINDLY family)